MTSLKKAENLRRVTSRVVVWIGPEAVSSGGQEDAAAHGQLSTTNKTAQGGSNIFVKRHFRRRSLLVVERGDVIAVFGGLTQQ